MSTTTLPVTDGLRGASALSTFSDELRRAADHPVPDLPGMLASAAWHIDRLIAEVARLTGQPEGAVLTGHGLGAPQPRP